MLNIQGGSSSLRKMAGYFILIFLFVSIFTSLIPPVSAEQVVEDTGHTPLMFHADPGHSGINDDGGTRPANILKWSFTTGDRVYSSPAVVDGVVYVGSDDNRVYALDAVNGEEVWNYTTGGRVLASPAVINGVVYVGSYDKTLYALDKGTGTKLWSFLTGGWVTADPVVTDGVVYSGSLDDKLYAINADTGAEIWNASFGVYPSIDTSPAVANGVVYVTGGQTTLYALDSATGATLWNFTRELVISGSPSVANNVVYVGCNDNNLYALDALTGEMIWNYTTGGEVQSCPAVAGNIVYFGSGDNNIYALDALTGEKIWNYPTGSVVFSSPTYANGVIYAGSWDYNMYALDALTGEKIWNYTTGSVVYSSPAVANGLVYFGSFDDNVYAVGSAPRTPVANFIANVTSGFTPMAVQFTDSSTGIQPLAYQWNFGDGTPNETIQNPVHMYSAEGTYNVTLTVSNSLGTSTLEKPGYITVIEVPIVGGGKGYYLVHSNAEGADVYFNNDWYEGKIENGTLLVETCLTCTPVWSYTVKKCGYFPLTQNNSRYPHQDEVIDLYANLTHPKEPLIPDFTSNTTTGPIPLVVGFTSHSIGVAETWNWSFGDGTYSEERDPVHTYIADGIYNVSLSGTNSACQNNTIVKKDYITAGTPPKPPFYADFTVSPVNGIAPMTVKCIDKSTGKPSMIAYDFGDGFTAMGPNAAHTYRLPGVYTITQTITKYNATTNSIMSSLATKPDAITVFKAYPLPPLARFTASPVTGIAPLTVSFTDTSLANPILYNYDFGDGVNSTSRDPVHIYRYPGTYNVTLTIFQRNPVTGKIMSDSSFQTGLIVVNTP